LKQSPCVWFGRFNLAIKKYGFRQSNSNHTLFFKHNWGKIAILTIYVDNMIIISSDAKKSQNFKKT
jgi:hypothetical protein